MLAALVLAADGGGNQTTGPGCVLITGKWKNMGRFKGPVLCSVASRPPYFHDDSAKDLLAVISFYDNHFAIGPGDREKRIS